MEQQATLLRLGRTDLRRMEQQDSKLALPVRRLLARTSVEKLGLVNRLIKLSQS